MKKILKYGYVSVSLMALLMVVCLTTLGSCDKQTVAEIDRAPFYVECDWTRLSKEAKDDAANITGTTKIYLFNSDGTKHNVYDLKPSQLDMLDMLEVGVYKAICVNINDHVEILYSDRFETTQMVAKRMGEFGASEYPEFADYNNEIKTGDEVVIYEPDWIFLSSMNEVRLSNSETKSDIPAVTFPMKELVKHVSFKFIVTGLTDEVESVSGVLTNVSSIVNLSTGKIVKGNQVSSPFPLMFDKKTGNLVGSTLIFGNEAIDNEALTNDLTLGIVVKSDNPDDKSNVISLEGVDVTNQMVSGNVEGDVNINVELELEIKKLAPGFITVVNDWKPGQTEDI